MSDAPFPRPFPLNRLQVSTASPRRTTHGSGGWTLPSGLDTLRQPQDGALTEGVSNSSRAITPIDGTSSGRSVEAEDARLNGTLRSLARRVKGLNVTTPHAASGGIGASSSRENKTPEPILRKTPDITGKNAAIRAQVA